MTETKSRVTDIDKCIGNNLQKLRLYKNMSQAEMGTVLDVTFQQVQKYENGANRLPAARLYRLHEYFGVPLAYFFAGCGQAPATGACLETDLFSLRVARRIGSVSDPALKRKIAQIVNILTA